MALSEEDVEWLKRNHSAYRVEQNGPKALLIFEAVSLPVDKFNIPATDILSVLPENYPDSGPDMFWVSPHLALSDGRLAKNTDVYEEFLGKQWQRWSRHFTGWKSGEDDVQTIYLRIQRALMEAVAP